jgi:hypothetical protein
VGVAFQNNLNPFFFGVLIWDCFEPIANLLIDQVCQFIDLIKSIFPDIELNSVPLISDFAVDYIVDYSVFAVNV